MCLKHRRFYKYCLLYLGLFTGLSSLLAAHGTEYEIIAPEKIYIKATYGSGIPMAQAQVLVFPPQEDTCSTKLICDTNGVFAFKPDRAGLWSLQVRDGQGHGMRINLVINKDLKIQGTENSSSISWWKKLVMTLSIIWGMAGTALYFQRNK